ncbi:hypothetical protein ABID26_004694 [Mesorhizobium shonense]|uniref:Uncharacterized protein n=1 Tax=Mesorhizobium shonense TaxID=1209948 RepID=A0ABV2HYZ5_9HYPH
MAGLLVTTEALVVEAPKDRPGTPVGAPAGGGLDF